MAMGIRKEFHHRGLDAVLYYDNFKNSSALGKDLERHRLDPRDKSVMINTIERMAVASATRPHRLFEAAL